VKKFYFIAIAIVVALLGAGIWHTTRPADVPVAKPAVAPHATVPAAPIVSRIEAPKLSPAIQSQALTAPAERSGNLAPEPPDQDNLPKVPTPNVTELGVILFKPGVPTQFTMMNGEPCTITAQSLGLGRSGQENIEADVSFLDPDTGTEFKIKIVCLAGHSVAVKSTALGVSFTPQI